MKIKLNHFFPLLLIALATAFGSIEGALVIQGGKIKDAEEVATLPVQEHFSLGMAAMNRGDWDEAAIQFNIVTSNFPDSSYANDSHYYLGISYFNLQDLDFANNEFSAYLKAQHSPRFFEQAIQYKLAIAEQFKDGARRRLFGLKRLPKWASAKTLSLKTYDEVIAALPCHELAAKALYSKGNLLWEIHEYPESVECFQAIIKRFPKHELAPESYLAITEVYLERSRYEFQNPDILALAQINLRRFAQDFPREERVQQAEKNVAEIKEIYAQGLYDTGQFYERIAKPQSSLLYYKNAIERFPETQIAQLCKERLAALKSTDG